MVPRKDIATQQYRSVPDVRYQNPTGFLAPGLGVFGGVRLASYGVQ